MTPGISSLQFSAMSAGVADRDRLRAESQALGDVSAVADAASDHEIDLVNEADVFQCAAGLGTPCHQRDSGFLGGYAARSGAPPPSAPSR